MHAPRHACTRICLVMVFLSATGAVGRAGSPASERPSSDRAAASGDAAKPAAARTIRVRVLDAQGKPLPGAMVRAGIWMNDREPAANRHYQTDAAGNAEVQLPKTFYIFRLWARKPKFAAMFANWEQGELASLNELPAEYNFHLEPAGTAGGRIVDEQGKPIAGARIQVILTRGSKPAHGDGRVRYERYLAEGKTEAVTDAAGRWHIDNVPNDPRVELGVIALHRDFVSDEVMQHAKDAAGFTTAMLRQGTATITLKRGVIVSGRVTDAAGNPIKDALVFHGEGPYVPSPTEDTATDGGGRFRLRALQPRQTTITVVATGFAPELRRVNLQADLPSQDFRLQRGKPIRLRAVDPANKPVSHARISVQTLNGTRCFLNLFEPPQGVDVKIPLRSDTDGTWEWSWAPTSAVGLQIGHEGFASSELTIGGGSPLQTVLLKAEHRITGRVTDAETGKPLPRFTVIPVNVFRKDFLAAERGNAVAGKDGHLNFLAERTDCPLRLRVEAAGYRTADGPEFRVGDDRSRTQDFRLKPSRPIVGHVVEADGRPAAKVQVLLATPTETANLGGEWAVNHQTTTDASGRFEFSDPGEPYAVVARGDSGFALAEQRTDQLDAGTLRLRAWASARGRLFDGGRPVRGATIMLEPIRIGTLDRPSIYGWSFVVTGPDGHFEFPRLAPGPVCVRPLLGPWKDEGFRSAPSVPLDLQPGQRVELNLGDKGATVSGRVKLTGKVPTDLNCTYSLNYLVRREPGIAPPPAVARLGFDVRKGWRDAWPSTKEGLAYLGTVQNWFVKLAPDGGFRISGVPPGDYDLAVAIYAKPSGCLVDPLARKVVRFAVTAADASRGELSLPEIAVEVVPTPGVGDTPQLAFERADGSADALEHYRGRYTVVHFWASWCAPCMGQLPALKSVQARFAARGVTTLGLSVDEDRSAWQTGLKHANATWSEGRVAAPQAGISSVPTYWLLDPSGKIVAKVYDPDALALALAERLK